jgi:hypothetical protein
MLWHPILDSMNSLNNRILAGKALLSSRTVTAYRNVDMLALETGQHGLDNFSLGSLPGVTSDQPSSTTKLDRGEAIIQELASDRPDIVRLYWMTKIATFRRRTRFPTADEHVPYGVSQDQVVSGDLDPVPAGLLSISELLRTL